MNMLRAACLLLIAASLSACSLVYRLPTRQGNVLEQKQLDQLKVGMTQEQVVYLLGTPLAASPFRNDRWDYVGYYKSPRGQVTSRTVSLFFEGTTLAKMEGASAPAAEQATTTLTAKQIRDQQKKDVLEAERAKEDTSTGVILGDPTPNP